MSVGANVANGGTLQGGFASNSGGLSIASVTYLGGGGLYLSTIDRAISRRR